MVTVETVAYLAEVGIASFVCNGQQLALSLKISTHRIGCDVSVLHTLIEVDDVRIRVANNMRTAYGRIETNDTRTEKRLNPAGVEACAGTEDKVVNPRHKFRFDAL